MMTRLPFVLPQTTYRTETIAQNLLARQNNFANMLSGFANEIGVYQEPAGLRLSDSGMLIPEYVADPREAHKKRLVYLRHLTTGQREVPTATSHPLFRQFGNERFPSDYRWFNGYRLKSPRWQPYGPKDTLLDEAGKKVQKAFKLKDTADVSFAMTKQISSEDSRMQDELFRVANLYYSAAKAFYMGAQVLSTGADSLRNQGVLDIEDIVGPYVGYKAVLCMCQALDLSLMAEKIKKMTGLQIQKTADDSSSKYRYELICAWYLATRTDTEAGILLGLPFGRGYIGRTNRALRGLFFVNYLIKYLDSKNEKELVFAESLRRAIIYSRKNINGSRIPVSQTLLPGILKNTARLGREISAPPEIVEQIERFEAACSNH